MIPNWRIWILAVVIAGAFAVGTYSIYRAAETGNNSRQALCNVLLAFRAETLRPRDTPRAPDQLERIDRFWRQTIALVDGCRVNHES